MCLSWNGSQMFLHIEVIWEAFKYIDAQTNQIQFLGGSTQGSIFSLKFQNLVSVHSQTIEHYISALKLYSGLGSPRDLV